MNWLCHLFCICAINTLSLFQQSQCESQQEGGDPFFESSSKWKSRVRRTAIIGQSRLWTNGTIHYAISDELEGNEPAQTSITEAIEHWQDRTCIQFINITNQWELYNGTKYLQFVDNAGCHSSVGRELGMGPQNISVGPGCAFTEKLIHELGHLVGLWHEHARVDRDNNVLILWSNVAQEKERNFVKMPFMQLLSPYDLSSMMHYDMKTFSANGESTIKPFDKRLAFLIGHRKELSFYDMNTVNSLYHCSDHCGPESPICDNGGFLLQNCTCHCPWALAGSDCNKVITSQDCGGTVLVHSEHNFTSPGYPGNYTDNIKCSWLFKSRRGTFMSLTFEYIELEKSDSGACSDQLEVRYHHIGISEGPIFCSNISETINTTSNRLIVTMRTNSNITGRGFKIKITTHTKSDCSMSPCLNGGGCYEVPALHGYMCVCKSGWIGSHCQLQIVHGDFNQWSEWTPCTSRCGLQARRRSCSQPAPSNGGRPCKGRLTETKPCGTPEICRNTFFCDFGTSTNLTICDMYQENKDDGNWALGKGKTPSLDTGPLAGHSQGTQDDVYLYLEGSSMKTGAKAIFWLPSGSRPMGTHCLEFYYTMHGANVATLAVVRRWNGINRINALWQRSGNLGQIWMKASLDFLSYRRLKIGFLGIRGGSFDSDIAIDDVSITPGRCVHKNREYGCEWDRGSRRLPLGRFSYSEGCRENTCFCNQDGYLDCPEWMRKDICAPPKKIIKPTEQQ